MRTAIAIAALTMLGVGTALAADAKPAAPPAPGAAFASLERVARFVKDRPALVAFYRDVLGYEEQATRQGAGPYPEGNPFGLPAGSHIDNTYLKSPDGAYVAILSTDAKIPDPPPFPPGNQAIWNEITLVHVVKNVDEIHARAKKAGVTILQPPKISSSGRSRQLFIRDPVGTRLELNEMRAQ